MREKLETLPLAELKELAKAQGIKGIKSMRKADLIDRLCQVAQNGGGEPEESGAKERASAAQGDMIEESAADQTVPPATENKETYDIEADKHAGAARGDQTAKHTAAAKDGTAKARTTSRRTAAQQEPPASTSQAASAPAQPSASRAAQPSAQPAQPPQFGTVQTGTAQPAPTSAARQSGTAPSAPTSAARQSGTAQPAPSSAARQSGTAQPVQPSAVRQAGSVPPVQQSFAQQANSQSQAYQQQSGNAGGSGHTYNAGSRPRAPYRQADSRMDNRPASEPVRQDGQGHAEPRYEQKTDLKGDGQMNSDLQELDSGVEANGILEVMPDGFGFIRCENYLPGENDVYVAPSQIRRFNMKTGDIILGSRRVKTATEKFAALLYIKSINGYPVSVVERRPNFEDLTPIFPNRRLHMETLRERTSTAMRVLDLLSPIGKGQRGMIVSPPKAGKTTLLKQVAKAVTLNHPDMHLIILLIDERPEEVTDIKESIVGDNVEVIYSTFDELPERHKRVSEMVIERAKRLVEHGRDVIILLDSITRLARAYNLTVAPSGRTLSGGLDPAALHMPKRFFGAARNMREGGSLTVLATALVDTGSRMDDVIYEEFKGTGNMELVLDRKLSEKRIFPAIDILKSGTRRDDLLLSREESEAVDIIRKATNTLKPEDAIEKILDLFARTRTNREFVEMSKKIRF